MSEERPEKLYRGIILNYEDLKKACILDIDMYPPHEAKVNEEGRKIVNDGNEYGVYMSDYIQMVLDIYSNPRDRGTVLDPNIRVSLHELPIRIPSAGIAYEIDTEGVDIREPWICQELSGDINNGYIGKEWITDFIPGDKYKIIRVQIGDDLLHNSETLDLSQTIDVKQELIDKIEARKKRLEVFKEDISKLDFRQRRYISREMLDFLKLFYGENGAKYLEKDEINLSNPEDVMKRILKESIYDDEGKVSLETVGRYSNIWRNFKLLDSESQSVENLKSIFEAELKKEESTKSRFIEMRKKDGREYTTAQFDRKINSLMNAISIFDSPLVSQGNNLRESAINAGLKLGLRNGMLTDAERVITPAKEEKTKTV